MFTGATFPSLLLAALCLVSRAVPYERRLEDLQRGEDKGSVAPSSGDALVSLSLTTPPAGDLLQINSSEEDRRLTAAALLLDSLSGSGPSFSSRLLDATDTWTEADRLRTEEVSVLPSSQDVGTEATMSSEDLPLIFEPFEDVTPAGASSEPSVAMTPAAVTAGDAELERMVSMDTDHTSSDVRLSAALETSGVREPITESHPAEEHHGTTQPGDDVTQSAVTHQALGLSEVAHLPASKPKTDTEDPKMKEETDEDEEDEEMDSEEEEEESEEDLTESTIAPHSRPPYGLIPPPPVWVQRNQGLVRSWVELIREKAGYVSGMLAPVGIGIAGALLLVGALYSIRVIHRKRRNSFKHQRRKPPREVRSGPDNAMLLADSSEDEF
ncbi:armadillo-like helical domain-containing protein 4 isoform X3 [Onychostoma macrolepis]|uniref:armadillo-like helical domain-containing protein 4 isoform X3 n=1 Tax=Onychostoma macrolepis TaxID=369639 RepID=UPI00272CEC69|nr:armadillo-like helical domain-containing protein 4 isoform X3 [Onychostoma macrolepis]